MAKSTRRGDWFTNKVHGQLQPVTSIRHGGMWIDGRILDVDTGAVRIGFKSKNGRISAVYFDADGAVTKIVTGAESQRAVLEPGENARG